MLRGSLLNTVKRITFATSRISINQIPRTNILNKSSFRNYASFSNEKDEPLTREQSERINDIAQKLRLKPEIKNLLEQFQEILSNNGFNPENPPSMFDMIRLLSKKDVKEHLLKLKAELDAADIKFGPEDIQSFMNFYNSQKK